MKCFAVFVIVFCCYSVRGQVTDFYDTDFSKADSIAERYATHSLIDLKKLANKLTGQLHTEQEKFRAIYKWVCSNIEADYELLTINKHNRAKLKGDQLNQWNREFNKMVFKTLLQEHKTICTGYAYLIRELAHHAGLSCKIVNGFARHAGVDRNAPGSINHSWNEIQLNNKWYVCDATWSSGIYNISTGRFVKKYNNIFFLTEPLLFFQSHYTADVDINVMAGNK